MKSVSSRELDLIIEEVKKLIIEKDFLWNTPPLETLRNNLPYTKYDFEKELESESILINNLVDFLELTGFYAVHFDYNIIYRLSLNKHPLITFKYNWEEGKWRKKIRIINNEYNDSWNEEIWRDETINTIEDKLREHLKIIFEEILDDINIDLSANEGYFNLPIGKE